MFRALALLSPVLLACAGAGAERPGPARVPERFRQVPIEPGALRLPPAAASELRVVARMQVAAPAHSPFVLHGTLPLPRESGPSELPGLALVGPGRASEPVQAQVEVVSRYPTGEPDVVELAALVELPADTRPGLPIVFDVVARAGEVAARPELPAAVRALLEDPGSGPFELRTRDVFGNVYRVDLRGDPAHPGAGSSRILASGAAKRVRRQHATLVPDRAPDHEPDHEPGEAPGAGEALAHLMGVHAYLTEWAGDERVSLDLRIHNGAISGSRAPTPLELPAGFVYWDALELVLPGDWSAEALFEDPFAGPLREEVENGRPVSILPLVRRYESGALHMMPPQAQFHRRLVLSPRARAVPGDENPALTGLAFCTPGENLWSWFQPETARYFPQRDILCTWERYRRGSDQANTALRRTLGDELADLERVVARGVPNGNSVVGGVMGWAHPFGSPAAGVTGGPGIVFLAGQRSAACASRAGVEQLMLEHRMNASRQAEAAWDAAGDPVGYHAWLDEAGQVPFDYRTNGHMVPPPFKLPARGGPPASRQVVTVAERGLRPPYDQGSPQLEGGTLPGRESIVAWLPHDGQHMVRYTKNTKALVWLAADALARDDLLLSGELFRLMFHESPHAQEAWSRGVTLREFERQVEEHPGQGAWIGRDQAWGIDAACAAYSVADPQWRARNFDWFGRVARFLLAAATPGGIIQRNSNDKIVGDERYDGAQAYESLFLLHAMRCLNESVLRGRYDPLRVELEHLVLRTLDYLYGEPVFATIRAPRPPHQERSGPRAQFAVALRDGHATPPFSDAGHWGPNYMPAGGLAGGVEVTYGPALLEYGFLLSRGAGSEGLGNAYLGHVLRSQGSGGWGDLMQHVFAEAARPSNDNSGNWAGLMGRLQSLGL